ncbi:hypothetical protein [Kitasatospora sp. NPDC086791]|uniref:hypothetical protein n=1 Tax=Kitasatospora sp. NPDC086791 TaxID=3155178 RepID=UPI00341E3769
MALVAPPMKLGATPGLSKQFFYAAGQLTVTGGIDQETTPGSTGFDRISKIKWSLSVPSLTPVHSQVPAHHRRAATDH